MSWKSAERTWRAFKTFQTLLTAYDKYKYVKDSTDLARQAVEIQKSAKSRDFTWDKVKLFKNAEMEKILKQLRKIEEEWKTAAKTELKWPSLYPEPTLKELAKLAKKESIDSKKVEAEIKKHVKWWDDVHASAAVALVNISAQEKRAAKIRKDMTITRDYMDVLYKAFRDIAKIPQPPSTAPQAQWLSLSQDALQAKGIANSVLGHVDDVDKNLKQFKKQSEALAKEALNWSRVGVKGVKVAVKAEL